MNKYLLASLVLIIIIPFGTTTVSAYTIVPPTRAYAHVATSNGTINAPTWDSTFTIKGIHGVTVTSSNSSVLISSGSFTPVGDRFGWFASDASGVGGVKDQHFYNFSTGHGISAIVGADDFILSAVNYANATSKTCGAGSAFTGFSNVTGVFTCSVVSGSLSSSQNIGKGTGSSGVLASPTSTLVRGKNLTASTGISISNNATDITISSTITQGLASLQNIGHGGSGILKISGSIIQGKNITSTDSHLTVSNNATDVNLSTSGLLSSAILTSKNTGKGTGSFGVLNSPTANIIQGKNLTAGTNISLAGNATDITITASGVLTNALLTTQNTGKGTGSFGVLSSPTSTIVKGKNMTAGIGISLSGNTTDITITATGGSGTVIGSQNVGHAANSVGTLATASSTIIKGRNFTGTSPITITKTNDTDASIGCSTCLTSALTTSQNIGKGTGSSGVLASPTGTIVKGKNMTAGIGLTNSNNATDITQNVVLNRGSVTNMSQVINATGAISYQMKPDIVLINGSNQTISKVMSFQPTSNSPVIIMKNNTGQTVGTVTQQGVWTGYINNPIGADYTININGTGFYKEYNGKTNQVLMTSQNTTDASLVIQDAWNRVNATSAIGKGGWVDVDCGTYLMQHTLNMPLNGNLTFTGHGRGCTTFMVPTASKNNNFVQYTKANTLTSFRNFFAHFFALSQSNTGTNTGFYFNGTGGSGNGVVDTTFYDVDVENFGKDCFYLTSNNVGDNIIDASILEKCKRAEVYLTGGNHFRIFNSKLILANGKAALILNATTSTQETGVYFSLNQYSDIYMDNGTKFDQIVGNNFESCSQAGSAKTDCIGVAYATLSQISDNFFNAPATNYYINFYANGTSSTTGMQVKNNLEGSAPVKGFMNLANTGKVTGALKNNDINNNFNGVQQYVFPFTNCFSAVTDPSKAACFYGMQNYAVSHSFNYTVPNANGTLALQPQSNATSGQGGANQTGTSSLSLVMRGGYATITPSVTGNIRVYVSGYLTNSVINDGCIWEIRQSTSNMGANGGTLAGTLKGNDMVQTISPASGNETLSKSIGVTGLTVGTKQFFDLAFAAKTGGTCTIRNIDWLLQEY